MNVLESFTGLAWGGACFLALRGSLLAVPLAAAACFGPVLARAVRRTRGD